MFIRAKELEVIRHKQFMNSDPKNQEEAPAANLPAFWCIYI